MCFISKLIQICIASWSPFRHHCYCFEIILKRYYMAHLSSKTLKHFTSGKYLAYCPASAYFLMTCMKEVQWCRHVSQREPVIRGRRKELGLSAGSSGSWECPRVIETRKTIFLVACKICARCGLRKLSHLCLGETQAQATDVCKPSCCHHIICCGCRAALLGYRIHNKLQNDGPACAVDDVLTTARGRGIIHSEQKQCGERRAGG